MTSQAPPSGASRFGFRRPSIYYGWYIVVATGFVMTIATVPLFHAMTLWAVALENQFGWPRGQLSLALTLTRIEGGLMGPWRATSPTSSAAARWSSSASSSWVSAS